MLNLRKITIYLNYSVRIHLGQFGNQILDVTLSMLLKMMKARLVVIRYPNLNADVDFPKHRRNPSELPIYPNAYVGTPAHRAGVQPNETPQLKYIARTAFH